MSGKSKASKRLTGSIAVIFVLALCLAVTTVALFWSIVSVEENRFHTGRVEINLNDGEPVISEHEFLFEPGMTVVKDFFVENKSTWDVYYRLYFDQVEGGLADVLDIRILDGDRVLYSGKASEMTRQKALAADDLLEVGERRNLQIEFHFPEQTGNALQNQEMSFSLNAEATQTKNNPDKRFD